MATLKKECLNIAAIFLKNQKVRISRKLLKEKFSYNLNFPSLLSISQVFRQLNLSTLIVQISINELLEIPLPCITSLKNDKQEHLISLTSITSEKVSYTDHKNKKSNLPISNFLKVWEGKVLLIQTNKNSGEDINSYRNNLVIGQIDFFSKFITTTMLVGFLLYLIKVCNLFDAVLVVKTLGIMLSLLLLIKTYGRQNNVLKSFCSFHAKINCDDILKSGRLKLMGIYSLSEMALVYYLSGFTGVLCYYLFGLSGFAFPIYISIMAFGVSLISIYFQAFILKKWCTLCLVLSLVIWAELVIELVYFQSFQAEFGQLLYFIPLLIFIASAWILIRKYLMILFEFPSTKRRLNDFVYDNDVFNGLLSANMLETNTDTSIQIDMGSMSAKNHLILVTNPTCHHCRKAHKIVEELLNEYDFKLTIRFFVNFKNKDSTDYKVAKTLTSLAIDKSVNSLSNALHDWFVNKTDLDKFLKKYDNNLSENVDIEGSLKNSLIWAVSQGLISTPAIIINSRLVPSLYSLSQVRYHIKEILEETMPPEV